MKKTLLTGLLSIFIVGPTFAEIDVSTMSNDELINKAKEICRKHVDTHFWVENDNVCVPLDACANTDYKDRYCDKDTFYGIRVPSSEAKELANLRAKHKKLNCTGVDVIGNQVRCIGRDYKTFKFKEIVDKRVDYENYLAGQCFALGGKYVSEIYGDTAMSWDHSVGLDKGCWYAGCLLINESACDKLGWNMINFSCAEGSYNIYTNNKFPQSTRISESVCAVEMASATKICFNSEIILGCG